MESEQNGASSDLKKVQPLEDAHFNKLPMWEAMLGILIVGGFYAALPSQLLIGPSWILLVIVVILLLPIALSVLFKGDAITLYVNGKQAGTATDSTYTQEGWMALCTEGDTAFQAAQLFPLAS